ncbi:MAG: metallophosphoesterase [Cyclobacteriaceae bacterium]
MATFVLGDIHGAYKALDQCIDRSKFDFKNDTLIFLGDVCDRYPETVACIDLLITIPKLVPLLGNHDLWLKMWLEGKFFDYEVWWKQGGDLTMKEYSESPLFDDLKKKHLNNYFSKTQLYHKDDQNRVFVHAGFDYREPIENSTERFLLWERDLYEAAVHYDQQNIAFPISKPYNEIYIGHTPTHKLIPRYGGNRPLKFCNVWCMDQGAGWGNRLSMMNVDTKEIFQSDPVDKLYN